MRLRLDGVNIFREARDAQHFEPTDGLYVRLEAGGRGFTTLEEHCYICGGLRICVPPGRTCDLASVPGWLHGVIDPLPLHRAGMFHDELYRHPRARQERSTVDGLFYEMLVNDGVPRKRAWLVYLAVRFFGGRSWRAARE